MSRIERLSTAEDITSKYESIEELVIRALEQQTHLSKEQTTGLWWHWKQRQISESGNASISTRIIV